jgi:hypothetical protein
MTVWYIIAGIAAAVALFLLIYIFVRDRRYVRKKTSEAMSRELWAEIDEERQGSMARREGFKKAIEEAQKR